MSSHRKSQLPLHPGSKARTCAVRTGRICSQIVRLYHDSLSGWRLALPISLQQLSSIGVFLTPHSPVGDAQTWFLP